MKMVHKEATYHLLMFLIGESRGRNKILERTNLVVGSAIGVIHLSIMLG